MKRILVIYPSARGFCPAVAKAIPLSCVYEVDAYQRWSIPKIYYKLTLFALERSILACEFQVIIKSIRITQLVITAVFYRALKIETSQSRKINGCQIKSINE